MIWETAQPPPPGLANAALAPLRIYGGLLGQIGDIVMYTAVARRVKELFPDSEFTFAISKRYGGMEPLLAGLPFVDRVFQTELYFERMKPEWYPLWELGWNFDLRGEDEVEEQRRHDLILETRPRHKRHPWWEYAHQIDELAYSIGVPGPVDKRTEVALPPDVPIPDEARGKVVLHNDPAIASSKAWSWDEAAKLVETLGENEVALIGNPGAPVEGVLDLRGETTLVETAKVISECRCYIGIDSGPMWIAGSLGVPAVGLYGTEYIPAYDAIYPCNPNAVYLQAEGSVCQITAQAVLNALYALELRREHGTGITEGAE
ncbi:MAG: glycosyltransferase family 9 protein [Armatimonadetes bacterium]|nr:glycosyltransferase family 9 protein [Armatimonadota bacterium]